MHAFVAIQEAQAITGAVDLFHMTVASDKPIYLAEFKIAQTTDLSDAQEEVLRIGIYRGVSGGAGGSALTESPLDDVEVTAGTAVVGQGTASTGGTLIDVISWNIRQEGIWLPPPELRPRCSAANDPLAFRLQTAPADSVTMTYLVKWLEG